jgi:hypothetical protein
MRKRGPSFAIIAAEEYNLRMLERKIEEVRVKIASARNAIWDSFREARDRMTQ